MLSRWYYTSSLSHNLMGRPNQTEFSEFLELIYLGVQEGCEDPDPLTLRFTGSTSMAFPSVQASSSSISLIPAISSADLYVVLIHRQRNPSIWLLSSSFGSVQWRVFSSTASNLGHELRRPRISRRAVAAYRSTS